MVEMQDGPSKQMTTNHTTRFVVKTVSPGASTGIDGNEAYTIILKW